MNRSLAELKALLADYDLEASSRVRLESLSLHSHIDSLSRSTKTLVVTLPDRARATSVARLLDDFDGDIDFAERKLFEELNQRAMGLPMQAAVDTKGKGKRVAEDQNPDEDEEDAAKIHSTPLKSKNNNDPPSSVLRASTSKKLRSILTNPPPPSATKSSRSRSKQPTPSSSRTTRTASRRPPASASAVEESAGEDDGEGDWSILDVNEASRVESNVKGAKSSARKKLLKQPPQQQSSDQSPPRRTTRSRSSSLSGAGTSNSVVVPPTSSFDYKPPGEAPSYEALLKAEEEFERRQKEEKAKWIEEKKQLLKSMNLSKEEEDKLRKRWGF